MSEFNAVSKKIFVEYTKREVQVRPGVWEKKEFLEFFLLDPNGRLKKISPAQWVKSPLPDDTTDYTYKDAFGLLKWGFNSSREEEIKKACCGLPPKEAFHKALEMGAKI